MISCWRVSWVLLVAPASPVAAEINYAIHIAPLLNQHCVSCHRPEGNAPFSLIGHEAARRRARLMADITADRYMPPWKPAADYGPPLEGNRRLSESDIQLLRAWADAGAPAGDLALVSTPPPPPSGGWTLGTPDLVLEPPEAYELTAEGPDEFRNFVLPLPLTRLRYVRAVEFLPSPRKVIHHVVIALDPTPGSRRRDEADPSPGFDSMDLGQAINPNGHIIGWTPGQVPYEVHPGTAWELRPGTDLIVQLHLLPSGKKEQVRPRIGLYFSDEPPRVSSTVIQLREYALDIPAGAAAHLIEQRFDLPVSSRVISLYPHAHYLGKDLEVFAELPGGGRLGLIRIPDWDFGWQSDYRFVEPVRLPAGARIVMRYTYDNSAANPRNPSSPPKRVRAGWNSFDEMGEVALQLLLDDPADRLRLDEAQARYDLATGAASPASWYNLALALDYQNRDAEARRAYETALTLQPNFARAANNLGALVERAGDRTTALGHYRTAVASDPGDAEARLNLARLLSRSGDAASARRLLGEILSDQPGHLRARLQLADLLVASRDPAAALTLLAATPPDLADDVRVFLRRGKLLALRGETLAARPLLEKALSAHLLEIEDPPKSAASYQAEAGYTLAILARESGRLDVIAGWLDRALKADPSHVSSRMMAIAVAQAAEDKPALGRHLGALLALPSDRRPSTAEIRDLLPSASNRILFARALRDSRDPVGARRELELALAEARSAGRTSEIELLQSELRR